MADLKNRYPLSNATGEPIPLDVVRPYGALSKTFLSSAATAAITIPAAVDLFTVMPSADCIVTFHATAPVAAALVDGTMAADTHILYADIATTLSPPIDKKMFSIRGVSTGGTALVNYLESWAGTTLQSQLTRR